MTTSSKLVLSNGRQWNIFKLYLFYKIILVTQHTYTAQTFHEVVLFIQMITECST